MDILNAVIDFANVVMTWKTINSFMLPRATHEE